VLDVGCGVKPYLPFFARAAEYVGVDPASAEADLRGSAEQIPVEDGGFDLVLCTQVLEHCERPDRAVRELRRVTAPGGRVLASTHGVQVYHPAPVDLWRWTHEGLARLFERNGDWASLEIRPSSGTAACLAALVNTYVDLATRRNALGRALCTALNAGAAAIDRRSTRLREPGPGTLHLNYHVTAAAP
jgi:SAM-dependent methyltransferase